MTDTGKIDRDVFETHIAPRLGATRDDVWIGPSHGVDFGVCTVGDQALVLATDPISILPELGFERAGRFAVRFVLADVAVSGISPSHLTISLSLPPALTDDELARFWAGIDAVCRRHDVAIVTGHTARYRGCQFPWIGSGTALAWGDPEAVLRPNATQPGDALVVTKGPAVETTGLLATLYPTALAVPEETLATAQQRLADTDVVADATLAAQAGARAMHDATEGGLLGALWEMATSAGVHLSLDTAAVPVLPGVEAVCSTLDIDPWRASSGGTLVIAASPDVADDIVDRLTAAGTPAAVVGEASQGSGVELDGEQTERPTADSAWPVFERLAGDTE